MPKPKIEHQNRIRIKKIHNDLINFPYLNIYAQYPYYASVGGIFIVSWLLV